LIHLLPTGCFIFPKKIVTFNLKDFTIHSKIRNIIMYFTIIFIWNWVNLIFKHDIMFS
jgi:hypothetical protein